MTELLRLACPHCGNVVRERGTCPMRFPLPDCIARGAENRSTRKVALEDIVTVLEQLTEQLTRTIELLQEPPPDDDCDDGH
jgi:hypothetical protein